LTYVYEYFRDFDISFSLSEFESDLLSIMSVTQSQLHPNGWSFVKAFEIVCEHLYLILTPNMFMYFYLMKHKAKIDWILLNGVTHGSLFTMYS